MEEPEPKGSAKRRALGCGCVFVVGLALAIGGLLLSRHTIAAMVLEDALARRGVTCTPDIALDLALDFSHMTLMPTRCVLPSTSDVTAVSFDGPVDIDLEGFVPTNMRAESVTVALRRISRPPEGEFPGPLAALAGARGELLELLKQGARASEYDLGRASIGELSLVHGATTMARARQVEVDGVGANLAVSAERLTLAQVDLDLDDVDASFNPDTGSLEASTELEADLGIGTIRQTMRVALSAEGLAGPSPTMDASIGTGVNGL